MNCLRQLLVLLVLSLVVLVVLTACVIIVLGLLPFELTITNMN